MILHLLIAPAAGFGMILIWAAIFGNTIGAEKSMFEEWLVRIPLYILAIFLLKLKKKYVQKRVDDI